MKDKEIGAGIRHEGRGLEGLAGFGGIGYSGGGGGYALGNLAGGYALSAGSSGYGACANRGIGMDACAYSEKPQQPLGIINHLAEMLKKYKKKLYEIGIKRKNDFMDYCTNRASLHGKNLGYAGA